MLYVGTRSGGALLLIKMALQVNSEAGFTVAETVYSPGWNDDILAEIGTSSETISLVISVVDRTIHPVYTALQCFADFLAPLPHNTFGYRKPNFGLIIQVGARVKHFMHP